MTTGQARFRRSSTMLRSMQGNRDREIALADAIIARAREKANAHLLEADRLGRAIAALSGAIQTELALPPIGKEPLQVPLGEGPKPAPMGEGQVTQPSGNTGELPEPSTPDITKAEALAAKATGEEVTLTAAGNPVAQRRAYRVANGAVCPHPQTGRNDYGDRVCLTDGCGYIVEFAPRRKASP